MRRIILLSMHCPVSPVKGNEPEARSSSAAGVFAPLQATAPFRVELSRDVTNI
jgi:hypothetical protein